MSSAIYSNLDQSEILSSGHGLTDGNELVREPSYSRLILKMTFDACFDNRISFFR